MYQYPYGNAQQLNLDWILGKIQEIEAGTSAVNVEEVANALISASFDAGVSYRKYDFCFYNGKLYRALNDTSGAFNPADWLEVVIGDDIPVLTRLLNAVDASLTTLQGRVDDLDSDDVDNASSVTGTTVSAAIDNLNGAITNGTLLDGMPQTGKQIPANSNLNDYTTAGTYWVQSDGDAATIANMPRPASGTLYVINRAAGNYKTQIYYPTTSIIMAYVRFCNAGTWTNWIMESDTNSNIAKVELTGQATQAYVVDDYVVVNGALYRVITPISNGDAFSIGTNISSTNVTDEIGSVKNLFTEIKTKTQTITTSSGGYGSVAMNPRAIILSIFVIGTGDTCVSFCTNASATEKGATTWWLTFRNVETWNVVASTQLNIGIVYIELP